MDKRLLLVDDEDFLLRITRDTFLRIGIHPDLCTSYWTAVDLLRESSYQMIVLDYGIPGKPGVELAREIRSGMHGNKNASAFLACWSADEMSHSEHPYLDLIIRKPMRWDLLIEIYSSL